MDMIEGDPIMGVQQAIDVAFRCEHCLYRGEPDTYAIPIPKIFRDRYWPDSGAKYGPEATEKLRVLESNWIYEFKRLAVGLATDLPRGGNRTHNLEWLFLMQHHGMPTRLLDWTQNILVALFFAVARDSQENDRRDGQIWLICTDRLNAEAGIGEGFPLPGHPIVEYLAREMFYGIEKKEGFAVKLGLKQIQTEPVAILPPLAWPRMIAQHSAFTLHPKPRSPQDVYGGAANLTRHKVPSASKLKIRRELRLVGVEYRALFPQLDSISRDMKSEYEDESE
jgi:hypothetical protein